MPLTSWEIYRLSGEFGVNFGGFILRFEMRDRSLTICDW